MELDLSKLSNTVTHNLVERIEELKYLQDLLGKENKIDTNECYVESIKHIQNTITNIYTALGQTLCNELYFIIKE